MPGYGMGAVGGNQGQPLQSNPPTSGGSQGGGAGQSQQQQGKTLWIGDVEPWMNENHIA